MKISISKDDNKVVFSYNEKNYEFTYDNINEFITTRLENLEDVLEFETAEDLEDYQNLLIKVNEEISKEDFLLAVKEVEEKKAELDDSSESALE